MGLMEPNHGKPSFLRNILVRTLLFFVLVFLARFAYVVTIAGESCNLGDFCFFSLPENLNLVVATSTAGTATTTATAAAAARSSGTTPARRSPYTEKQWKNSVEFHSSIFQDLISEGFLSPRSKSLCIESVAGPEVFALQELGVRDSIGIHKKQSRPLVISGSPHRLPFHDETLDFIFSGGGMFEKLPRPLDVAAEIGRTLKPEGYFVVHVSSNDTYSFNSFLDLFNSCRLLRSLDLDGFDPSMPRIREIVLIKERVGSKNHGLNIIRQSGKKVTPGGGGNSVNKCLVPEYKQKLVRDAEALIEEEPLKPWITLKRNLKNIKYLSSLVDISFRNRYVYVDVGARSYGSSIGSWFRKQYPKQNKTFDVYAIEADETFYSDYKSRKRVTLLPYAAWVKNETLTFEVNRDPGQDNEAPGRGMGRIQPARSAGRSSNGVVSKIRGFDFADWLKRTVSEKDYVVMKMDVEGTEFDLIPRLFKTGAICLIDELFLECHYNRWQRCCPGERSTKYEHTYGQCLELFTSLRGSGILVHQWW